MNTNADLPSTSGLSVEEDRPPHLVLVDDEENVLRALRRVFAPQGYVIETFSDPTVALEKARAGVVDLVISDYRMPQMDGVSFLTEYRKYQPDAMRMILSAFTDLEALLGAINRAQIFRFVSKPWNDDELRLTAGQALEMRRLMQENQRLADVVRAQQGLLSKQEFELRRLEEENPGITKVNWGPDGTILLDEGDA